MHTVIFSFFLRKNHFPTIDHLGYETIFQSYIMKYEEASKIPRKPGKNKKS